MKQKQIAITLQQIKRAHEVQHHTDSGFTTEVVNDSSVYEVIKMKNACVIDLNGSNEIRIGDELSETQADYIARMKCFEVTVIK